MSDNTQNDLSDKWEPEPSKTRRPPSPAPEDPSRSSQQNFADLDPAPPARPVHDFRGIPSVAKRAEWSQEHGTTTDAVKEQRDSDFTGWQTLWGLLSAPALFAVMAFALGVVGLFITTQLLAVYATIASLTGWEAWAAVALLLICLAAVLFAVGYFVFAYLRLRTNHQIHLTELAELGRWTSSTRQESMATACAYLEGFSLNDARRLPISEATLADLVEAKESLLEQWRAPLKQSPEEWLSRFVTQFQAKLDRAADIRVTRSARMVAFKTAISPNALIDTAIVLYWSFTLLGDLCRIYNLRVGTMSTVALLTRVFFTAYVASRLDEWEDHAEESLEGILDHLPAPDLAKTIVGRIGAKAGAGLANYFLLQRLGKRAIKMLRPIRV